MMIMSSLQSAGNEQVRSLALDSTLFLWRPVRDGDSLAIRSVVLDIIWNDVFVSARTRHFEDERFQISEGSCSTLVASLQAKSAYIKTLPISRVP